MSDSKNIKVAFITGHHPFDIVGIYDMFRSMPEVEWYLQSLQEYAFAGFKNGDAEQSRKTFVGNRNSYDAVVFYNFHKATPDAPGEEKNWWERGRKATLEQLGENGQGIFILHHGLLAFPEWDFWSDLCGIQDRSFKFYFEQLMHIDVANHEHPITHGLEDWDIIDEIYSMNNAGEGCEVLLTTPDPRSMHTIAWTKHFRKSRVFCLELGHDRSAYDNPQFRTVVERGIKWISGRL